MARLPRFNLPGQPQHVIVRGNNRSEIFCADEDYRFYLDKLQQGCEKHGVDIHAYVLMTNHVHLLATPHEESSIGKVMQMLGRYYVQYYNYCYRRSGTLFEGRYKAALVDSESYLLIRTQPGASRHGEASFRISLVELCVQCAGQGGWPSRIPW